MQREVKYQGWPGAALVLWQEEIHRETCGMYRPSEISEWPSWVRIFANLTQHWVSDHKQAGVQEQVRSVFPESTPSLWKFEAPDPGELFWYLEVVVDICEFTQLFLVLSLWRTISFSCSALATLWCHCILVGHQTHMGQPTVTPYPSFRDGWWT